jgi:hypothetical protein
VLAHTEIVADVRTLEGLRLALRSRADALNISRETLDEISGLQEGYSGKLLAPTPIKNLGDLSLSLLLASLGLRLVLIEDPAALERVQNRLVPRNTKAVRDVACLWGPKPGMPVSKRWIKEIGRKGGLASAQALTPEQRRKRSRAAAAVRWSDVKAAMAEHARKANK